MPLSTKFVADFSEWKAAVTAAQGDLNKLGTSADAAAAKVTKLTDESAGRFTITTQQMKAAGVATQGWTAELGKFDSVLSAVGVNIGGQVRALGELQTAAGQSVGTLGALGTAGLAAGAALAGWQIGRVIADVLGLDQKIANLTTTILGLPNLQLETAAAKTDVLARATKNAGREITDYNEAIRINTKAHEDWILATGYSRTAAEDSRKAVAGWAAELQAVRARGDIAQLTADLDSQNFSITDLSTKYGVHVAALQAYQRELAAQKAAEDARAAAWKAASAEARDAESVWAATLKTMAARTKEINDANLAALKAQQVEQQKVLELVNARIVAELNAKAQLAAREGFDLYGNRPAAAGSMEGATAAYQQEAAALEASGASAAERAEAFRKFQDNFAKAADAAGALAGAHTAGADQAKTAGEKTHGAGAAAEAAGGAFAAAGSHVLAAAQAVAVIRDRAAGQAHGYEAAINRMENLFAAYGRAGVPIHGGLLPGSRAAGGPVTGGAPYWVGETGPELFVPRTSGAIVPGGGAGAVTVNVAGILLTDDPGARAALATVIQESIMRAYREHGNRIPV